MKGRRIVIGGAVFALVAGTVGMGLALAGGPSPSNHIGAGHSVSTKGVTTVEPNAIISSTLRFSPERIVVESGEQVRWQWRDEDGDPHTVTLVERSDLPKDAGEVFNCRPCNRALRAHFGGGGGPVKKVEDDADGEDGLDEPGDSLFFSPGDPVTRNVSAAPGTRLHYVCAIHPWMQGKIVVE
jgi:plastocyanin